jgi:hypothetical protein
MDTDEHGFSEHREKTVRLTPGDSRRAKKHHSPPLFLCLHPFSSVSIGG